MSNVEKINSAIDAAKEIIQDHRDPLVQMLEEDFDSIDISKLNEENKANLLEFIKTNFYHANGEIKDLNYMHLGGLLREYKRIEAETEQSIQDIRGTTSNRMKALDESKINEALSNATDPLIGTLVGEFDNFNLSNEDKIALENATDYIIVSAILQKYKNLGKTAYTVPASAMASSDSNTTSESDGDNNSNILVSEGVSTNGPGILTMGQESDGFHLDETDVPFFSSIDEKLEDAATEDLKAIEERITDIKIDSPNLERVDWDDFFADLRSELDEGERVDFDKYVVFFKETPMYLASRKEESKDNEAEVEETETEQLDEWNSYNGLKQRYDGAKVKAKKVGEAAENLGNSFGLNIDKFGREIDAEVERIKTSNYKDGNDLKISLGGIDYIASSRKEALLMLYRGKLVLSELDKTDISTMGIMLGYLDYNSKAFGFANDIAGIPSEIPFVGPLATGAIGLLLYTGIAYGNARVVGGPIESVYRNTLDFISIRFGGSAAAGAIKPIGKAAKGADDWVKKLTTVTSSNGTAVTWMKRIGKISRIGTKTAAVLTGGAGVLVDKADTQTLEATLGDQRINIVDGIGAADDNPASHKFEEISRRYKVLDYYKKKWADDGTRIAKIEKLEKAGWFGGGQLVADSDTFFLKILEIDKGHLILTGDPAGRYPNSPRLDRGLNVARGTAMQTSNVFSFHVREKIVMTEIRNAIESQKAALSEVYQSTKKGEQIEIDFDKTKDFYNRILGYLELDSSIDNTEELAREKLLKDYLQLARDLDIQGLTKVQIRRDLFLLTEKGHIPKGLLLKEIAKEMNDVDNKKSASRLKIFYTMVENGKWYGTTDELEMTISDVKNLSAAMPTEKSEIKVTESDIKKITDRGSKLRLQKFEREKFSTSEQFKNNYKADLDLALMGGTGVSTDHFNAEMDALYDSMTSKDIGGEMTRANDYTVGHVNYIIENILEGKTFSGSSGVVDRAIFDKDILSESGKYKNQRFLREQHRNDVMIDIESHLTVMKTASTVESEKMAKQLQETYFNRIENNATLKSLFEAKPEFGVMKKEMSEKVIEVGHLKKIQGLIRDIGSSNSITELNATEKEFKRYLHDNSIDTSVPPYTQFEISFKSGLKDATESLHLKKMTGLTLRVSQAISVADVIKAQQDYKQYIVENDIDTDSGVYETQNDKMTKSFDSQLEGLHIKKLKQFMNEFSGADEKGFTGVLERYNTYIGENTLSTASGDVGNQKVEVDNARDKAKNRVSGKTETTKSSTDTGGDRSNDEKTPNAESSSTSSREASEKQVKQISEIGDWYNTAIKYAEIKGDDELVESLKSKKDVYIEKVLDDTDTVSSNKIKAALLMSIGLKELPSTDELQQLEAEKVEELKKVTNVDASVDTGNTEEIGDTETRMDSVERKLLREKMGELEDLGRRASLELLIRYEGDDLNKKLTELDRLIITANESTDNLKTILSKNTDMKVYLMNELGLEQIRTTPVLNGKIKRASNMPDGLTSYSDITSKIRSINDPSILNALAESLKKANIGR